MSENGYGSRLANGARKASFPAGSTTITQERWDAIFNDEPAKTEQVDGDITFACFRPANPQNEHDA